MAQERLPALPALAVPDAADLVYVVDVDDATDHATGSSKKSTVGSLPVTEAQIAGANFSNWDSAYGWGNHALAGYLTSFTESNDLSVSVTWANVPDANITESSVTQHEAAIDHGSITGLGDDDHTQYHNNARGDARYYTETELDAGQLDNRYYTESEVDGLIPTNYLVDNADDTTTGRLTAAGFTTSESILSTGTESDDLGTFANRFGKIYGSGLKVANDQGLATAPNYNVTAASSHIISHRHDGGSLNKGTVNITMSAADATFPTLVMGYTNVSHANDIANLTTSGANAMIFGGCSNFFNGGFTSAGFVGGKSEITSTNTGSVVIGTAYVGFQGSSGTQSVSTLNATGASAFVVGTAGHFGQVDANGGGSGNVADMTASGVAAVNLGAVITNPSVSNNTATSTVSGSGALSVSYITRGLETVSGDGSLSVLRMAKSDNTQGVTVSGDGALSVVAHTGSGSNVNAGNGSVMVGRTTSSGILNVGAGAFGSVVVASVTGSTDASVTAANAMQLGVGTNATATSFQVGDVSSSGVLLNGANGTITSTGGRFKNTSRYTTTQTILATDDVVFANTDSAAWTATLPAGVEGQTFKIINSGSSGNTLTIEPDGSEDLLGMNSGFTLADRETLVITYNSNDGWF
ncbi:MAG: hypothetical protein GY927_24760 [bacterium]|nr:hypothetical protein [bacterium]